MMQHILKIGLGLGLLLCFLQERSTLPLFFDLKDTWSNVATYQKVFEYSTADSLPKHTVKMALNKESRPLFFTSGISTAVCADGECKLASIVLYWDLLGNYVGYDVSKDSPLAKNDHDVFTASDYAKLHQLFSNKNSIMRRKTMDELVDKVVVKNIDGVDAVSGATKEELKAEVVKGGLYSCFTLWHLVYYKSLKKEMQQHTFNHLGEEGLNYLLDSKREVYQMAALKKMPAKDFEKYQERIIELFGKTSVLTQTYILKKMPETVFNQPENRKQFYVHFKSLEATSQTILIEKLKKDYNEEIELVASSLGTLHKNQVKLFLKKIERAALTPTLRDKLENYAQINATYSYLVQQFLAQ